jgi:Fe-S-cluster containining protein
MADGHRGARPARVGGAGAPRDRLSCCPGPLLLVAGVVLGVDVDELFHLLRQVGPDEFSLIEKPGYDCIFLRREKGLVLCDIYAVRPMQCRTWPFWNQNLQNPRVWKQAAAHCPGMRSTDGPTYDLEKIEACRTHPESP